jgi:hypothetical protein
MAAGYSETLVEDAFHGEEVERYTGNQLAIKAE